MNREGGWRACFRLGYLGLLVALLEIFSPWQAWRSAPAENQPSTPLAGVSCYLFQHDGIWQSQLQHMEDGWRCALEIDRRRVT